MKYIRGFTLLETIVTIFVFVLIMGAIVEVLRVLYTQPQQRFAELNSIDQISLVGTTFGNELRDAQTGSDGSFALAEASTSEIIFFSPYGSGVSVRRIRYFLSSSTLYKGIVSPSGAPPSYNLGAESVQPLVTGVIATTSVFSYYDGTYAGTSTPLSQPVNLNNVKFVQIRVTVLSQDIRNSTSTYSFKTGAAIRSLKTNLGN